MFFVLSVFFLAVGTPSVSAQSDQYDDCSIWAWVTHNCAINPKGPCCQGNYLSAEQSGEAWHNNQEACKSRLDQTYKACLDDKAYSRRSCDASRRQAETFCGSVEKTKTLTMSSQPATRSDQYDDCSIWAWVTHNCAINPKGPCCQGNYRSAEQSGEAWHNNQEACTSRLEQTYKACRDDEAYSRRSCDASRRQAETFCGSVEKTKTLTMSSEPATQSDQYDDCSIWAWVTHNCAINPKGPCCQGNYRSAQQSGKAWYNDKEACKSRLDQTYKACRDDKAFTRQSCDQNKSKGADFCKQIKQVSAR